MLEGSMIMDYLASLPVTPILLNASFACLNPMPIIYGSVPGVMSKTYVHD